MPPPSVRYLAYDGPLVAADLHAPEGRGARWAEVNHVQALAAALLHLVALAVFTGRTLVGRAQRNAALYNEHASRRFNAEASALFPCPSCSCVAC